MLDMKNVAADLIVLYPLYPLPVRFAVADRLQASTRPPLETPGNDIEEQEQEEAARLLAPAGPLPSPSEKVGGWVDECLSSWAA